MALPKIIVIKETEIETASINGGQSASEKELMV